VKVRVAGRALAWVLRKAGRWAICLPPFGIYVLQEHWFNRELIRHEGRHWLQAERLGVVKFYSLYAWYTLRYGYWDNPLERDARG
jgi:hypothetical protein